MTRRIDQQAPPSESAAPDSEVRQGVQTPGGLPDCAGCRLFDVARPQPEQPGIVSAVCTPDSNPPPSACRLAGRTGGGLNDHPVTAGGCASRAACTYGYRVRRIRFESRKHLLCETM